MYSVQIVEKGESPSPFQVIGIALPGVSLPLERDIAVAALHAAILDASRHPLHRIPYIERQVEQLAHLGSVDAFVASGRGVAVSLRENDTEEIDGEKIPSKRYQPVVDNLHNDCMELQVPLHIKR